MDALEREWKTESRLLAESCADAVRLRLIADASYAGGEAITVDKSECAVSEVKKTDSGKSFTIAAEYQGARSVFSVELDAEASLVSLMEIPSADL
jgi:hypothetical protein